MLDGSLRSETVPLWHRGMTDVAIELHKAVHPARWCITFADLKFFQSEVRRVIQDGMTFQENFEASYGPSMYVVNEQYIKPVTAAAGKMSWALMMNPDGLDCDLFITHAWQEDVFEFTDKVLTSWPWRARHAWCCMLANPQNLDIGALLQSPSMSPFALALQSSKYMLVVPNRHKSVYTRLWCGYEAYLAFQSNKIIRTASPSIWREALCSWLRMFPALLVGLTIGVVSKVGQLDLFLQFILTMRTMALLASLVSQHCGLMRLCLAANHVGLAGISASFLRDGTLWSRYVHIPFSGMTALVLVNVHRILIFSYFLLAEVDRVNCQTEMEGAEALQNHYQGSIRHASCSEVRDEVNIRHEIGDQVDEVDKVIQVLLKAGISSDALRTAYLQGVEIRHAGFVQLAIPVLVLGPLLLTGVGLVGQYIVLLDEAADPIAEVSPVWLPVQCTSILARLVFLCLFCRRSIDEQCFMLNVMAKIVTVFYFCEVEFSSLGNGEFFSELSMVLFILYSLSFLVVLFFAVLGIRGTLKLPGGRQLVQFFLSRLVVSGNWRLSRTEPAGSPEYSEVFSQSTGDASGSGSESSS
ncbi:unnamed protein product [Durusdinium trenchii]|uniref:Uncharacterized protein n=1 Tax=Durusdinium trenchii TaxID=1381693 RepID=A0ABP0QHY8_9DINO